MPPGAEEGFVSANDTPTYDASICTAYPTSNTAESFSICDCGVVGDLATLNETRRKTTDATTIAGSILTNRTLSNYCGFAHGPSATVPCDVADELAVLHDTAHAPHAATVISLIAHDKAVGNRTRDTVDAAT